MPETSIQSQIKFPNKSFSKIEVIQVLRGVSACLVMLFHLRVFMKPGDPFKLEIDYIASCGPAGVDLFFVISGFIMVLVTTKFSGNLRESISFLLQRLFRVWPLYAFATISLIIITYKLHIPSAAIVSIVKSIFFVPLNLNNPPFFGYPVLNVGWSLNYEVYFYFLVSLSLLFGKYRWYFFGLIVVVTLVVMPILAGNFTMDTSGNGRQGWGYVNLITNPVIWTFVYGVIIGLSYTSHFYSEIFTRLFAPKLVTYAIVTGVLWQYLSGFYGGHGPGRWGLGMALLFTALIYNSKQHPVNYPSWLVHLGNISFSIYLWHLPVARFIQELFIKLDYPIYNQGPACVFLMVAITLIVSQISYQFFEQKLVFKSFENKKTKNPHLSPSLS